MRPTACALVAAAVLLLLPAACGGDGEASSTLEEARLLRQSGSYSQALLMYEDAVARGDSQPEVLLEMAETAVLAAQAERSTLYRQKAVEALALLTESPGETDGLVIGELWRRLAWEMVRNGDSLQAFQCLENALDLGSQGGFEEEWLLRGTYAGDHLQSLTDLPDSLAGTPTADSILSVAAEEFIVELDRVPMTRTDLRTDVLKAKADLLPFTGRREDELGVLTELDRLGEIEAGDRQRRIQLLIEVAQQDIEAGREMMARDRLLEVWGSEFAGERIEAAYELGLMSEAEGDPQEALQWYRSACNAARGSTAPIAAMARAKRDSLVYETGLE